MWWVGVGWWSFKAVKGGGAVGFLLYVWSRCVCLLICFVHCETCVLLVCLFFGVFFVYVFWCFFVSV